MTTDCRFDVSHGLNIMVIYLGSSMGNIDLADKETRKFLKDLGLMLDTFAVSLVMREGLTNAIKHGHGCDINKIIKYSLSVQDENLIMEIEDQGAGFNWREAQKKLPETDRDHGRGFTIIKKYFTDYSYNERGNKLILTKKI
jgi:serine/threonine-protein kinase RsbW